MAKSKMGRKKFQFCYIRDPLETSELGFGELCKQIRVILQFTQRGFAEKLGLSVQAIKDWENSRRLPRWINLEGIKDLIDVEAANYITIHNLHGRHEIPYKLHQLYQEISAMEIKRKEYVYKEIIAAIWYLGVLKEIL
jgi:transcriptional regulator with XRE-family HTH domain